MSKNSSVASGGIAYSQDAESLFRTKPISEIRNVESITRKQIQEKSEELRQLVGNRYRDLIDSADSIVQMKSSCESIAANISGIHHSVLHSLSSSDDCPMSPRVVSNPIGAKIYGLACRVKYLVDTPEDIWGCLDESMFHESAARYVRAKHVHYNLLNCRDSKKVLSNFPLLQHQWQVVEGFKVQISQRSRERLLDHTLNLGISAYANALAGVSIIDEIEPRQILALFIDSRKSIISQKLSACCHDVKPDGSEVILVLCDVLKMIQVTICQVGELFLQVLNDMPLFYKTVLYAPPASQLFGGIPNPDEEAKLWNQFREKLESDMVLLDRDFISTTCSGWLRDCGMEIMSKINGTCLIDVIGSGHELALAEKSIRETMDSKQVLEGSLEWLKSVFGSEIELPWKRTRELVLGDDSDLWDDIFEDAFVQRMKRIIHVKFTELSGIVDVVESVRSMTSSPSDQNDSSEHFNRFKSSGGVWFANTSGKKLGSLPSLKAHQPQENDFLRCLSTYLGPEVTRIKDAVDNCCENVLSDLISFLESPNAPRRLKDMAPYAQEKCYETLSTLLRQIKNELDNLQSGLENKMKDSTSSTWPSILVERSLFIGRLLFAIRKHAKHVPKILGSPRSWATDVNSVNTLSRSALRHTRAASDSPVVNSPSKRIVDPIRKNNSLVTTALYGMEDKSSPQLEEIRQSTQDLCYRAYNLWISWVSNELSDIISKNLKQDDALSSTAPIRGWEETVVKQQEQSSEQVSEMKISLPSMPSLYVTSFLFHACEEIHRVGGHVLDKPILQNFASRLFDKVIGVYGDFLQAEEASDSKISDRGILQFLFDLKFAADILSGGKVQTKEDLSDLSKVKSSFRRKHEGKKAVSVTDGRIQQLINRFSQRLDPIDWLTYEPYLWENERQAYLRHAVLFGFFVQLNRLHTDTVQKLPTNSESNVMRCSTIPRFKYLPISAPALSARNASRASVSTSANDIYAKKSWSSYANDDRKNSIDDDNSSLGVAAPFLKSFMQVGSRFGESTLRLGSMLTDGQVGRFGDILPAQAAGLLSSFTNARSDY